MDALTVATREGAGLAVRPEPRHPTFAPPRWSPRFVDHLDMSVTNATAVSPTAVVPRARWATPTMMGQAAVSPAMTALVVARATGSFRW